MSRPTALELARRELDSRLSLCVEREIEYRQSLEKLFASPEIVEAERAVDEADQRLREAVDKANKHWAIYPYVRALAKHKQRKRNKGVRDVS